MLTALRRLVLAMLLLVPVTAAAATLLPNGEQSFTDNNGAPLAGGQVYFYVPGTTTPKDTWQDSGQTILNTNPVTLDAAGRAIIYGAGAYREIVRDANGNTIWDQLTADTENSGISWAAVSGGSANAQTVTASNFSDQDGQELAFVAGFTNSGAMTLNVNGAGPISVLKGTFSGPVLLTGGEVVAGNVVQVVYDATRGAFQVVNYPNNQFPSIVAGNATFTGTFALTGVIAPSALGASVNDWNPTGLDSASIIRASASAAVNITGIAGGSAGRQLTVENIGAINITLTNQDAASSAANRFALPRPLVLRPNQAVTLTYDGTTSRWRSASPLDAVPISGSFTNLVIQNGSNFPDTRMVITADAVTVEDANGEAARLEGVHCTIDGSTVGAGGLDTGTLAASTWYALFAIYNPAAGTQSCLASLSATAPTLPSGYTMFHRFGWARTDASIHFWRTKQEGRDVRYIVGTNPVRTRLLASGAAGNTSTPTWVAVDTTTDVPTTASAIVVGLGGSGSDGAITAPNNSYGALGSNNPAPIAKSPRSSSQESGVIQLESSNIYWASDGSGNVLVCYGWKDNL